jgi:hypothetical protein
MILGGIAGVIPMPEEVAKRIAGGYSRWRGAACGAGRVAEDVAYGLVIDDVKMSKQQSLGFGDDHWGGRIHYMRFALWIPPARAVNRITLLRCTTCHWVNLSMRRGCAFDDKRKRISIGYVFGDEKR